MNDNQSNIRSRVEQLLNQLTRQEKISLMSGVDNWHTAPIPRLGIPSITMTDGPHGVRAPADDSGRKSGPATSYPTGVSMGASWNPELIEQVGIALGEETRHMECHILLGPCVNIVRSPLAGRNFETYSEDPFLAGRIGAAFVAGVQSQKIGTSVKHYACNNQEIERFRGNSVIDERTLREIYLAQFETIIKEAHPWTVMVSYNRINGIYASENPHTIQEILRREWGYEGVVISDWGATHTTVQAANAGLDIEMPGPAKYYGDFLVSAVKNWQVEEEVIDASARRILTMIVKSGVMDDPTLLPVGSGNTLQHQELARQLAEESITLLKNENHLLPLDRSKIRKIAVIGPNATDARIGGGGSSFLEAHYTISPLEGLKSIFGERAELHYEMGCTNFVQPPPLQTHFFIPKTGQGTGLTAEYYDGIELDGEPVLVRVDPDLNLSWWGTSQIPGLSKKAFSVRWSGSLQVPQNGDYTFFLLNTDISRIYLDGKLILENNTQEISDADFESNAITLTSISRIPLEAGKKYEFRAEFIKSSIRKFAGITLRYMDPALSDPNSMLIRAIQLAKDSEVAIIFAGMPTGYETEGTDRPTMNLPGAQDELIEKVVAANPNTIVVLNCGSPVRMPWIDKIPALLLAYYPGQEGGNALARIITGEVNPSGKLPETFPVKIEDNPAYINYPGYRDMLYGEGIYVGYRYYDLKEINPLFPFGHGLSYTIFDYNNLVMPESSKIGDQVTLSVQVQNSGNRSGMEVVQLYVTDHQSTLPRPPKELKGFKKVNLEPGETKTVTFTLDERAFSFYDPTPGKWIVEPGEFGISIGSSSRDIRVWGSITLR